MRRFPISWDKTITALGFKRKLRHQKKRNAYGRRNHMRIESLEQRAMLSVAPTNHWSFDTDAMAQVGSVDPSFVGGTIEQSTLYQGGGALRLDGTDDYVELNHSDLHNPFSNYTITAWFKADDLNGTQMIFEEGGLTKGIALRLNGSTLEGAIRSAASGDGASTQKNVSVDSAVNAGEWHFVALTYEGGSSLNLYLDGVLVDTNTNSIAPLIGEHTDPANIGKQSTASAFGDGDGSYFDGLIDEVKVYDGITLSENNIQQHAANVHFIEDRIQASEDAYVRGGVFANQTHGEVFHDLKTEQTWGHPQNNVQKLIAKKDSDANNAREALLRFDLSSLNLEEIVDAKLDLTVLPHVTTGVVDLQVHEVTDTWDELGVTWNNKPSQGTHILSFSYDFASGNANDNSVSLDLTSFLKNLSVGTTSISFLLSETTNGIGFPFASSEHPTETGPELVIKKKVFGQVVDSLEVAGGELIPGQEAHISATFAGFPESVRFYYDSNKDGNLDTSSDILFHTDTELSNGWKAVYDTTNSFTHAGGELAKIFAVPMESGMLGAAVEVAVPVAVVSQTTTAITNDAYARKLQPDTAYGASGSANEDELKVKRTSDGYHRQSFLEIDISEFDANVTKADLKITPIEIWDNRTSFDLLVDAIPTDGSFDEETLTWNNRTTPVGDLFGGEFTIPSSSANQEINLDITKLIQEAIANNESRLLVRFSGIDISHGITFASSEHATLSGPKLVVTQSNTFIPGEDIVVDSLVDENDGNYSAGNLSLREAIEIAKTIPGDNTITFDTTLLSTPQTITVNQPLAIDDEEAEVHVSGPGADLLTVRGGFDSSTQLYVDSVFVIETDTTTTLSGLKVSGGRYQGIENDGILQLDQVEVSVNDGIGINSGDDGVLTIDRSTVAFNDGGGIRLAGTEAIISNTTITGNEGFGGIEAISGAAVEITNATITNNDGDDSPFGGGINAQTSSEITIYNSIIVGNTNDQGYSDIAPDAGIPIWQADFSGSNNLIGEAHDAVLTDGINPVDLELQPLGYYGGSTRTIALGENSIAIDAGSNGPASSLATDQRGLQRFAGSAIDIGAYETTDTIVVNTISDAVDLSDGVTSLREAIELAEQAPGENIITFDDSLFPGGAQTILLGDEDGNGSVEGTEASSQLYIDSSLSIIGPGSDQLTINGGNAARVVLLASDQGLDVAISGLTITGGLAGDGAGLFSRGNDLDLDSVTITGNYAVIADPNNAGNYLGQSGSNKAYGGGIYFAGQDASNESTLTITNSQIDNNYAGMGGGIYGHTSYANINIDSTTIDTNTAFQSLSFDANNDPVVGPRVSAANYAHGGGISLFTDYSLPSGHDDKVVAITNSTISNNLAIRDAGGLSAGGGSRLDLDISNSTFSGNEGYQVGGIKLRAIDATITNSTITDNHTERTNYGGGLHSDLPSPANITLNNSIVAGNTAGSGNYEKDILGELVGTSIGNIIDDWDQLATTIDVNNQVNIDLTNLDLQPLADYGGPTRTHALGVNSIAIDTGDDTLASSTDQRGYARFGEGPGTDIGAVEEAYNRPPTISAPTSIQVFDGDSFNFSGQDSISTLDEDPEDVYIVLFVNWQVAYFTFSNSPNIVVLSNPSQPNNLFIRGSLEDINQALSTLEIHIYPEATGQHTIHLYSHDLDSNELGGQQTAHHTIELSIPSRTPVINAPSAIDMEEVSTYSFDNENLISIEDADNQGGTYVASVSVPTGSGTLNLSDTTGITFVNSSSNNSDSISIQGALDDINNSLETLSFTSSVGTLDTIDLLIHTTDPEDNNSQHSTAISFNYVGISPVPPENIKFTEGKNGEFAIAWEQPTNSIDFVEVEFSNNGIDGWNDYRNGNPYKSVPYDNIDWTSYNIATITGPPSYNFHTGWGTGAHKNITFDTGSFAEKNNTQAVERNFEKRYVRFRTVKGTNHSDWEVVSFSDDTASGNYVKLSSPSNLPIDGDESAISLTASVSVDQQDNPSVTLIWPYEYDYSIGEDQINYTIKRKLSGTSDPFAVVASLTADQLVHASNNTLQWTDTSLDLDTNVTYEYSVGRFDTRPENLLGYKPLVSVKGLISVAVELDHFVHSNRPGGVIVLVEQALMNDLSFEINRYVQDLQGDGWEVVYQEVDLTGLQDDINSAQQVKSIISGLYTPNSNFTNLVLIGDFPVVTAGTKRFDGHGNPSKVIDLPAEPTDNFYGDLIYPNSVSPWVDNLTFIQGTNNSQQGADGSFDLSFIGDDGDGIPIELAVGRIDMSSLNNSNWEDRIDLLRRYLDRNHAFRHGQFDVDNAVFMFNNGGAKNQTRESARRNYSPSVGLSTNVVSQGLEGFRTKVPRPGSGNVVFPEASDWENIPVSSYMWGSFGTTGENVGNKFISSQLASRNNAVRTVFNELTSSYSMDWDSGISAMSSIIAADGYGLTSFWSNWGNVYLHHMASGSTIGEAMLITQSYDHLYGINVGAEAFRTLIGDPTLRSVITKPPTELTAVEAPDTSGVQLNWMPSPDADDYVILADYGNGYEEIEIVTETAIGNLNYFDESGDNDTKYMVRSRELINRYSGTFYNLSQGAFSHGIQLVEARNLGSDITVGHFDGTTTEITTPDSVYANPAYASFDNVFSSAETSTQFTPSNPIDISSYATNTQFALKLYFAEIDTNVGAAGDRLFDIYIEGNLVLENFDIFGELGDTNGSFVGMSLSFTSTDLNSDGDFDFELVGKGEDEAILSAFELYAIE